MDLILVTGFLGAGKTTFLKKFIRLFLSRKLALVVNEFGREGVDGPLLSELGVTLSEINNGSIFCSCRADYFEAALTELAEQGFECVITETSGLSDPTTIRGILSGLNALLAEKPTPLRIDYQGCICLVDAVNFKKVVDTAIAVKNQLAASSLVLLNKTDLATREELDTVRAHLREINPKARLEETSYGALQAEWFAALLPEEGDTAAFPAVPGRDLTLQKYTLTLAEDIPQEILKDILRGLLPDCDRVKGFVRAEGKPLLVNCVEEDLILEAYPKPFPAELAQKIVVLSAGGRRTRTAIKRMRKDYGQWIVQVE